MSAIISGCGPFVGEGGEHRVFADLSNPNRVIKIPRVFFGVRLFGHPAEVLRKMYIMLKEELSDIILESDIRGKGNDYSICQARYPDGSTFLSTNDLVGKTRRDFEKILAVNRRLWRDGKCLDFLGLDGFLGALNGGPVKLGNVLKTPSGEIVIGDFTLLDRKGEHLLPTQRIQHGVSMLLTRIVMQENWGIDIKEEGIPPLLSRKKHTKQPRSGELRDSRLLNTN